MALHTPPSWLQNGSHPAVNDRLTTTGVIWHTEGVADYDGMKVSQLATPGMAVQIASGHAIILGDEVSNQGFYIAYNDAATTVAVATASPTLPRIDRICVSVQDAYYSGANNQVVFQAVTGTPASSPGLPTEPVNTITLATVAVAAGATSITDAVITNTRTRAQFNDTQFTAQSTAADTIVANQITSQTGKALKVADTTNTQKFAIGFDGTITFQDGSTQNTASAFDPNIIVNTQTGTTYTLAATDAQKLITCNNSGAITVTIASNSSVALPAGTTISIAQYGVGQVTVVGASSPVAVTVVSVAGTAAQPKTRTRYSVMSLIQTSTNNWLAIGDIQ
jgi:hypothetical protein